MGGPSPGHRGTDARYFCSGGSTLKRSRQEARLLPDWSGSHDESLRLFFFFKHEREKEIPAPLLSAPALPREQTSPSGAPTPPRPCGGPGRSPRSPARTRGRPGATSPPPRRRPPGPALGRGPGLPAALMLLECGRRGPRVPGSLLGRRPAGKWGAAALVRPRAPARAHSPAKSAKGSSQ